MTPEERTLLTRYLNDLVQARNVSKDQEAASLISQALTANPDAFYLLVQHAIVADHSLQMAQERIHVLEDELSRAKSGNTASTSSFLGGALDAGGPWGRAAVSSSQLAPSTAPAPQATAYSAPSSFPPVQSQPSGFSSFLRNVGTTAMGVAAGEALFSGVGSLFGGGHGMMGGFGGSGFGGSGIGGSPFGGGAPVNETVIVNNYNEAEDWANDDDTSSDDSGSFDDSDTFA